MRNVLTRYLCACVVVLCATATATRADVLLKQKTTIGGQTSETTWAVKGTRQRYEFEAGAGVKIATITQCDQKRRLTLNSNTKRYLAAPLENDDAPTVIDSPASDTDTRTGGVARRGGIITYTDRVTLLGTEKRFGLVARHIKTVTTIEPDANACDQKRGREETDGWYVDLNANFTCATGGASATPPIRIRRGGCEDEIRRKQIGTAKLGYPIAMTRTTYNADGTVESSYTMETLELSTRPLDDSLFTPPADYSEARNAQELYAATGDMAGTADDNDAGEAQPSASVASGNTAARATQAKRPGTIRIGVVALNNRADRSVPTDSLRDILIGSFSDPVEAVALASDSPDAIDAEAKQKECDFVLYTDIVKLKQSAAGKVGGFLGRATGVATGVDKTESRVDFKLVAVGGASSQFQSSATAKEEGDEASVAAALRQGVGRIAADARKKRD